MQMTRVTKHLVVALARDIKVKYLDGYQHLGTETLDEIRLDRRRTERQIRRLKGLPVSEAESVPMSPEEKAEIDALLDENKLLLWKPSASSKKRKKIPQVCLCGCSLLTKGGRFCPGHDARYHRDQKKLDAK